MWFHARTEFVVLSAESTTVATPIDSLDLLPGTPSGPRKPDQRIGTKSQEWYFSHQKSVEAQTG
jgi:hypothetical protein